jgi:nicotinamide riboside transporter PnuC
MAENWLAENIVEIFGAVTGIVYVILEIRRNILLWPLGIITSAVYIYVFGREGFYANMGLQWYYLVISIYGWYQWHAATASKKKEARRVSGIADQGSAFSHENSEARRASGIVDQGSTFSHENSEARRASGIVGTGDPIYTHPHGNPEENDVTPKDGDTDVRRIDRTTAIWSAVAAAALWAVLWIILDRATDSPVPLWDGLIASLSVVATWMLTRKYIEQWYVWIFANAIAVAVYLASGLYPTAVLFMVYFIMAVAGVREWNKSLAARQYTDPRRGSGNTI